MKIHNVRLGFATNSSSTHSIIFCENPPPDDDVEEDYFGWEQFTASSESIKGEYLARQLYINLLSFVSTDIAESVIKDWCSNISRGVGLSASGVDHQSVFNLPQDYDCNGTSKAFFKELSAYIMKDGIVILGGNDNADEKHPLLYDNAEIVLPLGRDDDPRPLICRKDSQGYWSIFNKHTGVKVRFSFDDLAHTPLKSSVPELVDLKITDFCSKHPHPIQDTDWNGSPKVKAGIPIYKLDDAGNPIMGLGGGGECDYCYQGSSPQGKHGNTKYISSVLYNLAQAEVFEVACLAEGTLILSKSGYIPIEQATVGKEIYTSDGSIKKITKVTISERECVEVIGSKGFSAICTPDHPFISSSVLVEAKDLQGLHLDTVTSLEPIPEPLFIDVSKNRIIATDNCYSRSGNIKGDKYKHSSSSEYVPCKVEVTKDLMFFYGLVVAEGSKKGIALNKNEEYLAHRVGDTYRSISGKGYSLRPNPNSQGMSVEFKQPKFYEHLFFTEMLCGKGAHNTNLAYLYYLEDKELIRSALHGLFEGDGCYRKKRTIKGGKIYYDFVIQLKTVSRTLAFDTITILKTKFGVTASLNEGVSPERILNGKVLKPSKYYAVDINGRENIDKVFPFIFEGDVDYQKIGSSTYSGNKTKPFILVKEILPVGIRKVYDLTLEDNSTHIFVLSHGVLTHNCSGGEPTQHPDFCNIIETAHGYGIVPNFTTKSLLWLKTSWAKKVLEECGGFAYSVTNHKQIEHFKAVMDKFGYPGGKYYKRLQVHIVLGTVSRTEFKKMLITASNCHVGVTLLGYKTTGRGCEVKPIAYGWWLAIVKEVRESRYIRVGIDTVIAQDFERELSLSNIPDLLYHKQEGKFSCYIDAVTQEIAPSSFALRGEFKPLAPHGKWVETYQSF